MCIPARYGKIGIGKIQEHNMVYHSTLRQQCRARHGSATYHTIQTKSVIHTSIIIQEISIHKNGELNVKRVSEEDISLGGFEILDRKEQARQARVALIRAEKERQEQARKLEQEEYDDYDEDDSYDDEYDNEDDDYDLYV